MLKRKDEGTGFPLASAFALYSVAFVVLAWPWLSGAVTIPYDAVSQFDPPFAFIARSIASGQSPFWTPNVFAGWPLIADPQSLIFSPFHIIAALFDPTPTPRLADALMFAQLYLGGAALILFFRDRNWHVAGALVAALAFAFGGSAASRIQHIGEVQSLVYFPITLWLLQRALVRLSWPAGLGAGVSAALIVLGRDQVALIEVYVLAAYVVWYWFDGEGWRSRLVSSLKPLVAGAVAGALIVTVPVTLTALLAAHSNRPEIGFDLAVTGSLHPASMLMLAFADVFGASDFAREFWGPPSLLWHNTIGDTGLYNSQNMGQVYVGALVAVALVAFGLMRDVLWRREIRFFTAAVLFTLIYSLGKYTPAFRVMYELMPGVSLYRRPADATFVFCGLLAIVGGYLIHRWVSGTLPAMLRWQYGVAVGVVLAAVADSVALALRVKVLDSTVAPLAWGGAFIVAATVALWLAGRLGARSTIGAAAILVAFTVADLAFKKAAAAPDRRDRVELIGIAYHWPNIGLIHDFDHLFGHNPLRLADFQAATAAYDTTADPQRPFTALLPSYRSTLEDLFGVRFVVLGAPIEKIEPSLPPGMLELVGRTKDAYLYENKRALPRVLLATEWRLADFAAMLRDGNWPDVDPRRTVLLERPPANVPAAAAGGTARILHYRNTDIAIEADAPNGGFVVLNDIWHPWWRATVDGKPADILKANVLFRAVVVPPGKHVVRFSFHPLAGAFAELKARFDR
ncbi:MAG: hypothetical protein J0H89_01330 [Rhizobiales bacterium]|nr:hypothetical protein [Hyphomicrobiales bacterium]